MKKRELFEVDKYDRYDFKKSSMAENRNFLYNLVSELKPKKIVELGTYYGCSYFAFAQAIKDHNLKTELIGIDAWQGDQHTGFYGEEVFKSFSFLKKSYFPEKQFKHVRKFFNQAAKDIPDNSVDILLIDGTHNAEDAEQDFKNYLPKLKDNGIVLFHDTKVQRFTLRNYWNRLTNKHIAYNFNNRFGLGVLAPKGVENFKRIQQFFPVPKVAIYSAIFGGKDELKSTVFQTFPVKKILFTDRVPVANKDWKVHVVDSFREPRKHAKGFKVIPHVFKDVGTDFDYLIWVDGSIKINNIKFVEYMVQAIGDRMVGFLPHPDRNDVYKEYDGCIAAGRLPTHEDKKTALNQLIRYKKEGLLPDSGLYAGAVFIRNMKHPRIEEFNNLWWDEINKGSIRDQLSLPYVLWKMDEAPAIINLNLWNNKYFSYVKHAR